MSNAHSDRCLTNTSRPLIYNMAIQRDARFEWDCKSNVGRYFGIWHTWDLPVTIVPTKPSRDRPVTGRTILYYWCYLNGPIQCIQCIRPGGTRCIPLLSIDPSDELIMFAGAGGRYIQIATLVIHLRIYDFLEGWLWEPERAKRASIEGVWAYGRMKLERLWVRTWAWLEMYKLL